MSERNGDRSRYLNEWRGLPDLFLFRRKGVRDHPHPRKPHVKEGGVRMEKKTKMLFALTLAALAVVTCALIMFDDEDSVAADVTHVSTAGEFLSAIAQDNFNIVLAASFFVENQITVENSGTIDFNGNTISSSYVASEGATGDVRFSLVLKKDVTLKNGTYKGPTSDLNDTRGIVSYGNLKIGRAHV